VNVVAIILAAGYSSRMGEFKPLLPFAEQTALERAVALFRAAGVDDVRVVVGHRADELAPTIARLGVSTLVNERYADGMFSSVVTGVTSLDADCDAFFLLPVDVPLVRPHTVELLMRSFADTGRGVVFPALGGEPGHPPLIARTYHDAILAWDGDDGLRGFLARHADDTVLVETGDEGVLLDMDTPAEYERLRNVLRATAIPSVGDCEHMLLERFSADSALVAHSRAVASLTCVLAERLNAAGCRLDVERLYAAALLHDIERDKPDHAAAGAATLRAAGYPAVADLVAEHVELAPRDRDTLDEAQLLYLADKLVRGDELVPLDHRFAGRLASHASDPHVRAKIIRRLETAREILARVEDLLGEPVGNIWEDERS
jgi:molybdenum cofactor cytidylyltransferase